MSFPIAVLGAGLAGAEVLNTLEERGFEGPHVHVLATRASMGTAVSFGDRELKTKTAEGFDFAAVRCVIAAAGATAAKAYAPKIAGAGAFMVDLSDAFRMDPAVPLVVPEVNPDALARAAKKRIAALPDPAVAMVLAALKPLHDAARLTRFTATIHYAVSGAGKDAMDELFSQTRAVFVGDPPDARLLPKRIAFNLIPQAGNFRPDGDTDLEAAFVTETRKILDPDVKIAVTALRVPVFVSHAAVLNAEFENAISPAQAQGLLRAAPGLMLIDRREDGGYTTPVEAVGEYAVQVSRVRKDASVTHGLSLWVTADNLRKSAALNAVQIAETLIAKHAG
jgi:aspartate-semialdehyde dehydrogenase